MTLKLHGRVAATHTPFDADGRLNLAVVEAQADHLLRTGAATVFVGSTGESHSPTVEERLALARRWSEVARGTPLRLVVQVGANCLTDARALAALALGAAGGVGSSYNFAAPLYHRMMNAFARGDLPAARTEQCRSVQLIGLLAGFGYMAAVKAVMGMLGVGVGPARLPHTNLTPEQHTRPRTGLERLGFFDWVRA